MAEIRVRFTPRLGGSVGLDEARAAVIGWLHSRRHDGTFVLCIDDGDRPASIEEQVQTILDDIGWLGIEPDEGPYYRSQGRGKQVEDGLRLLREDRAYRDFDFDAERPDSARRRRPRLARGKSDWRAAAGHRFEVLFEVPEGLIEWDDLLHGRRSVARDEVEDFAILRPDGEPTSVLSSVSDDLDMQISHVIERSDDPAESARRILLYRALGRGEPALAALPALRYEEGEPFRPGGDATSLAGYRERGYLPEAIFHFLARLGRPRPPEEPRRPTGRRELIDRFDLSSVDRSVALVDRPALDGLNREHLAERPAETLVPLVRERLEILGLWKGEYDGELREWLIKAVRLLQPGSGSVDDLVERGRPFFELSEGSGDEIDLAGGEIEAGLAEHLGAWRARLAELDPWEAEPMERALRALAEAREIPERKLIEPTGFAMPGERGGERLFEVLELIGKRRTLARLDRLIAGLNGRSAS